MKDTTRAPGLILPEGLYTLSELQRRTGLGPWALRKAQRAGLRTLQLSGRKFCAGKDFIEFVQQQGAADA